MRLDSMRLRWDERVGFVAMRFLGGIQTFLSILVNFSMHDFSFASLSRLSSEWITTSPEEFTREPKASRNLDLTSSGTQTARSRLQCKMTLLSVLFTF
jgi:hypothetical protein